MILITKSDKHKRKCGGKNAENSKVQERFAHAMVQSLPGKNTFYQLKHRNHKFQNNG